MKPREGGASSPPLQSAGVPMLVLCFSPYTPATVFPGMAGLTCLPLPSEIGICGVDHDAHYPYKQTRVAKFFLTNLKAISELDQFHLNSIILSAFSLMFQEV